jgi:putative ABC transport system permease protein
MGLALVQIWANRTRSVLTTIGIIIGVASVTSVIAALSGLKAKVLADFETFGTRTIWVWPDRPKIGPMRNASWQVIRFRPETFDDMLDYCRSVDCFTRSCSVSATVRFADRKVEGVRVNGVESAWHKIMNKQVVMGREFSVIDQQQGRNICIIPPDLRDQLRLDKDCVGQSIVANGTTYRIVGVIEKRDSGMFDGGGNQKSYEILVPFNTIYRNNRTWMSIMAASKKTESAEEAKAEIAFFLRKVRHIAPGEPDTFGIETIESHINTFQNISKMITLVAGSVVSISLLVGGIGIMNIMLVSVSERTREIGLRKAVGARRSAILMQFLVESVVLSLLGGIFGILLGQLFTISIARAVSLLDKMYIPIWAIMVSFGFSAAVGVFFGMFPAIKAANLDPIEALRHE